MSKILKNILTLAAQADAAGLTKEAAALDSAADIIAKFALDPHAEFNKALTAITQSGQPISQEQMMALRNHYFGPNAKPAEQPITLPTPENKQAPKATQQQAKPKAKAPAKKNPKVAYIQEYLEQARNALNEFASLWDGAGAGKQYPPGAEPTKPALLQVPIVADGFWGPKTANFIRYGLNLIQGQHYKTLDQLKGVLQEKVNFLQDRVNKAKGQQPATAQKPPKLHSKLMDYNNPEDNSGY